MSKSSNKLPRVFLACPFDKDKDRLVKSLNKLPWKIQLATDRITSDHLLKKITAEIKASTFVIFDISGWNPNVCLELGLARGLNKEYYIINNTAKKKDAPSDIKGIDRIDYDWDKRKNTPSLYDKIKDGIFKKKFFTKNIWDKLQNFSHADKKFELALHVLQAFKASRASLNDQELKQLARGMHFKKEEDFEDVKNCLMKSGLFTKVSKTGALKPLKKLYQ